jgi:predicted ribosomally synthesized peptide with SipW-like signal peptide
MKKIIGLSLILITVIGIMGIGTFASFSDGQTSSGNSFVSGILELKINDANGVSQTLYATGMSPGATVGSSAITLKNIGTVDGATLDIIFSYTESDDSPNTINKTADEVAAMIEIITLDYGGSSLLSSVGAINSNGYKDVYDLANSTFTGLNGINAGATKNFDISVRLRSEIENDFQSDGITITMTFILRQ